MDFLYSLKSRLAWLTLGLLALTMGMPLTARAGSAPSGAGSGVTTTGSSPLPIGGSPITPQSTTSTSPNVTLDPTTGELLLTAEAQASLNQTASQVIQQLEATYPGLTAALGDPLVIDPDRRIDALALAVRGINDGEPVPKSTLQEAAVDARSAVTNYRWAELYIEQEILTLTAPLVVLGSEDEFSLVALYTPPGSTDSDSTSLRGTLPELGNAAAFLVLTAGSGIAPQTIAPFVDMAAAGVPYPLLLDLLLAVNGLVVAEAAGEDIDADQLNRAIHAYRAIVTSVDQATLNQLRNNSEFLALRQALLDLRNAIET